MDLAAYVAELQGRRVLVELTEGEVALLGRVSIAGARAYRVGPDVLQAPMSICVGEMIVPLTAVRAVRPL